MEKVTLATGNGRAHGRIGPQIPRTITTVMPVVVVICHYTHTPLGNGRNRPPAIFLSSGLTSKPSMIYVLVPQRGSSPKGVFVVSAASAGRKFFEFLDISPSQHNLVRFQRVAH